jgi:GrpB-like predicted nucleotidyltransferase (UPF0157 family)
MSPPEAQLTRHPSLDERFDPAIRIVEHDPGWASAAARELSAIESALRAVAVRVDHVGSTSVPGLAAKPILDLQVSVRAVDRRDEYVPALEGLGYLFAPDHETPDFHLFAKPPERPRFYHLHVCQAGSDHELRHLAVRDFLRAHRDEALAYEAVKRGAAAASGFDRLAYIKAKDRYVVLLEARAVAWARGRDRG